MGLGLLAAGQLVQQEEELPTFKIDLSLPPGHRFNETIEYFKDAMDDVMPNFVNDFPPDFVEMFADYD